MEGQEVGSVKKSRAKYEIVIIILVILAAVVVALGISRARDKAEKGKLLLAELDQVRAAVQIYVDLNKSTPPDLASLVQKKYSFSPGETPQPYLAGATLNKEGELIDPFGNPYIYDKKTGRVSSATKDFEQW